MAWTSNVKNLTSDPTKEAWAAFAVSIINDVGVEYAFEMLSGRPKRKNRKWTDKDVADVVRMREEGMTLQSISEIYGTTKGNISKLIKRKGKQCQE